MSSATQKNEALRVKECTCSCESAGTLQNVPLRTVWCLQQQALDSLVAHKPSNVIQSSFFLHFKPHLREVLVCPPSVVLSRPPPARDGLKPASERETLQITSRWTHRSMTNASLSQRDDKHQPLKAVSCCDILRRATICHADFELDWCSCSSTKPVASSGSRRSTTAEMLPTCHAP